MIQAKTLDILLLFRFIAAAMVIRQHANFPPFDLTFAGVPWGNFINGSNTSGGAGIIFFFFITAYLLSKNFFNGRYKLTISGAWEFYLKRFSRIAPLYYFVTIFAILFVFPYLINLTNLKNGTYILQTIQIFTFQYYGLNPLPWWNQVYWALSVEMAFYILLPIIIWPVLAIQRAWIHAIAVVMCIFAAFVPFQYFPIHHPLLDFAPVFLAGIFTAAFFKKIPIYNKLRKPTWIAVLTCFLLYSMFVLPIQTLTEVNGNGIILTTLVLFIIAVEAYDLNRNTHQPRKLWTILNYLGTLSYALFLTHMIFLIRINNEMREFLIAKLGETWAGIIVMVLTLFVTILASAFLYHSVENPASKWAIFKPKQNRL